MTSQLIADPPWLPFLAYQPPDACCCNADCPGTGAEQAGQAAACEGCPNQAACASAPKGPDPDLVAIEERMRSIKHKILVLSGKGGVGKSTFSAQLAFALASHGRQVCAHLHTHLQPQPAVLATASMHGLRAHLPAQLSTKGTEAAVNMLMVAFSTAVDLITVAVFPSLMSPLSLTIAACLGALCSSCQHTVHCCMHFDCPAVFFSPACPRLWQAGLFRGSYSNPALKRCCLLLFHQR